MFEIKKLNVFKSKSSIVTLIVGLILAIMVASVTYFSIETANYNEERHLPVIVTGHDTDSEPQIENQELYNKIQEQNAAVRRRNTIVRLSITIVVFAVILATSIYLASVSDKSTGKLLAGLFFVLCLILALIIFVTAPVPSH